MRGMRTANGGAIVDVKYSREGANGKLGAVVTAAFEADSHEQSSSWLSWSLRLVTSSRLLPFRPPLNNRRLNGDSDTIACSLLFLQPLVYELVGPRL
jgi:hypothetical protein